MQTTFVLPQLGLLASAQNADPDYGDGHYSGFKQNKRNLADQEIDYSVPIAAQGVDLTWLVNVGRAWEQEEYPSTYLFVENTTGKQATPTNPFSVVSA
jgi:hypothetical protein